MRLPRGDKNRMYICLNIAICIFWMIIDTVFNIDNKIVMLAMGASIIAVQIIQQKMRSRDVKYLVDKTHILLHSEEFTVLDNNHTEGELSVLGDEIRKMSIKLREAFNTTAKEKIYLMDSMADISHQIRTPLTTINIQLALLQEADISELERRKYISSIKNHLERIEWLISSLLKISKMDAGVVAFKEQDIYINELIGKAVESLLVPLEIKNQHFEYRGYGDIKIKGDFNWFLEAISNIVKNCVEHTSFDGKIKISVKENQLYTAIVIEDDGKGIEKEDIHHIFERFYKGKNSDESSVGIGLALSKMIIQKHNGTIKVENKKDKGCRFTIKIYKGVGYGSS